MKALLYCTKAKPYLVYGTEMEADQNWHDKYCLTRGYNKEYVDKIWGSFNGFIVAECDIDKVEEIAHQGIGAIDMYDTNLLLEEDLCYESSLSEKDLHKYLNGNKGYALYLSNIEVFEKPKTFGRHSLDNNAEFYTQRWDSRFKTWRIGSLTRKKIGKNMRLVYSRTSEPYVLIPMNSESLCKILNGEKTIEIRKCVLKCLKEMVNDNE